MPFACDMWVICPASMMVSVFVGRTSTIAGQAGGPRGWKHEIRLQHEHLVLLSFIYSNLVVQQCKLLTALLLTRTLSKAAYEGGKGR
jgi:hypothetical protein